MSVTFDILSDLDYVSSRLHLRTPDELADARTVIRAEIRERGPVGWRYARLVERLLAINAQIGPDFSNSWSMLPTARETLGRSTPR